MKRERAEAQVAQSARPPLEAPTGAPVDAEWTGASILDAWSRPWSDAAAYWADAWQRGVLYLDVLRRRGNQYREHMAEKVPHVLSFTGELVADGRELERPVNYGLVRITPPEGLRIDPKKRPFVVVDPRAGHGPGIGGFKADSEIGVALHAGHPCYFVGFLPHPVPGQTVEDVMRAEARFLEVVTGLHPEAEGKPVVVGNCQAGWQVLMTAATRPELFGPIVVAGSPLSYWAGERGRNPMRYTGGLLGGSWLTALAGDLGHGLFDGAWLVQNFEKLNPANTLWTKQHNVYSKIDTEPARYLGFERYWGGYVLLNAEEMQWIVDNLFVGNKLATAEIVTSDGRRVDLRNIASPIVCFCSKGDNITPPPQALGWITDLYQSVDDIRTHGQTIVYCVHESVGHLGIFVSGGVARKEHEEFASNIDFIDILPPGLYEAVIVPRGEGDVDADLVAGDYLIRFAARDIADVQAIVGSDPEDERRFAAAARVSAVNLGLYRSFLHPLVRAAVDGATAEWMRHMHPLRLKYELLSDDNPLMRPLAGLAERVREERKPAAADNLFTKLEVEASRQVEGALDDYRDLRDRWHEQVFLAVYGSPLLQALVGLRANDEPPRDRPGDDPDHREFVERRKAELLARIGTGGLREAGLRALLHVLMPQRTADERTFNLLRRMRDERGSGVKLADFKAMLREQDFMLQLDPERAVATLPSLLAEGSAEQIRAMLADVRRVAAASGPLGPDSEARLGTVARIFEEAERTAQAGQPAATAGGEVTPLAAAAPAGARPSRSSRAS
jgi:pimeloyl-ACP methyl ester carboxylesterase